MQNSLFGQILTWLYVFTSNSVGKYVKSALNEKRFLFKLHSPGQNIGPVLLFGILFMCFRKNKSITISTLLIHL